jgi:tRNA pseudouridine32 synthase/23S rRNA pseudouridine746 synthase
MIDIIFENSQFIVLNKPAGISFHKDDNEVGFFSLVKEKLGLEIFSVHRLDKVTSGLIVFAKDSEAASVFGELFSHKKIQKTYIALSDKRPSKKQGLIKGDIEKARGGSYKLSRLMSNPSLTKFTSTYVNELRIFKLLPLTGKTHQLRVVMNSLGSPIIGDERYKGSISDRTYLHAYKLEFELMGEVFKFECLPTEGLFGTIDLAKIIESF